MLYAMFFLGLKICLICMLKPYETKIYFQKPRFLPALNDINTQLAVEKLTASAKLYPWLKPE